MTPPRTITVRLGTELAALATGVPALADRLTGVVRDLVHDLAIPVDYTVEVVGAEDGRQVTVTIDGQPCRIPVSVASTSTATGDDLARELVAALHASRELLLPADVAAACWCDWIDTTSPPPAGTLALMRGVLRRGVRLERLRAVLGSPISDADALEQALAAVDGPRLRVFVSTEQHRRLYDAHGEPIALIGDYPSIARLLALVADGLFYELGIVYRLDQVETDPTLAPGEMRFAINGMRTPVRMGLQPDEVMVNTTVDRLDLGGRPTVNPANLNPCTVLAQSPDAQQAITRQGLTSWDDHGYLILELSQAVRRYAGSLMSTAVAQFLCERLQLAFPDLVAAACDRYDHGTLARVLRGLLDEDICIRDLRTILETLLAFHGVVDAPTGELITFLSSPGIALPVDAGSLPFRDPVVARVECVRTMMQREISSRYTRGQSVLTPFLIDPDIESRLKDEAPLSADEHARLIDAIGVEVMPDPAPTAPVILTTATVRLRLHREIEYEYPHVVVLAYQDLSPALNLEVAARITWN